MGRVLLLGLLFLIITPMIVLAVNEILPDSDAYIVTTADLDKARDDLMKDYRAYSDEQYIALDGRIQAFFIQFRQKVIMGLLGINAFVAGVIFYYLNKSNKGLSYESVALRRGRSEEERQFVVQNMNYIRDRLQQIEAQNAQMYETYVIPIQRFMEDEQNRWQRENQGYVEQGEEQQQPDSGGGDLGGGSDGGFESPQYGTEPYETGFPVEGEPAYDQSQYQQY
jgi:hypothetical protein